jgi:hypothetical protein
MKISIRIFLLIISLVLVFTCLFASAPEEPLSYTVLKIKQPVNLNGDWDNAQWMNSKVIEINKFLGKDPAFHPVVEARVMYNDANLFVIFRVQDRFVKCVTSDINGPVWEDSCVEFFFSPDVKVPDRYFNLEVNCGGTALMHYNLIPRKDFKVLSEDEVGKIKVLHSLPRLTDPERSDSIIWTIEYSIPLSLIEKYSTVTHPVKGVCWRANFYKIADKTANPHYISWSPIENGIIDFHQPQFFGILKFD